MTRKLLKALYLSLLISLAGGLFFGVFVFAVFSFSGGVGAAFKKAISISAYAGSALWWMTFPGGVGWQFPNRSMRSMAVLGGVLGALGFWLWAGSLHVINPSPHVHWGIWDWFSAIWDTLIPFGMGAIAGVFGQKLRIKAPQPH